MKDFYKGKKVFLTGHTGFKGTWASLMLKQLGAEVHGFSLPPEDTRGNLFNMVNLPGLIDSSEFGDVTNANTLSTAVKRVQPDIIFHMAAQAFVRRSYNDPATNYASNVMGTVNIFEAARALTANSTKPLILLNVTTDKCYENIETTEPYIETDRIGGHDPYSTSKACLRTHNRLLPAHIL